MSTKLEDAVATIKTLPADSQARVFDLIAHEAAQADAYILTEADHLAIDEGIADADAGRFASAEDIETLFSRFR